MLPVDTQVESILFERLRPGQIAIAIAAPGQIEEETRQVERQWALRRERARYEAKKHDANYGAVEPEIACWHGRGEASMALQSERGSWLEGRRHHR
ncbi:hypothetical protein ACVDG5_035040 [Mesorhizobium sp. ORM6]